MRSKLNLSSTTVKVFVVGLCLTFFSYNTIVTGRMVAHPTPQPFAGGFRNHHFEGNIPIPGYMGPEFQLSQDYPKTLPANEAMPWKAFDFKTQSAQYLKAVLDYAMEGNITADWAGQNNTIRKWYHAPWLDAGSSGREFVRGLTAERPSGVKELHPLQNTRWNNYAVGINNPLGGYVIGQVWNDPDNPNAAAGRFPEGSVAFKLLFTTATITEVPYLQNTLEWDAYVRTTNSAAKKIQKVRLLQIDIAVRDSRANSTTGWVFGTFQYDGTSAGASVWDRMKPVGLMWGNDPKLTQAKFNSGKRPKESIILNDTIGGVLQHLGWNRRLNGPVDNPVSSCLSCHAMAADPTFRPMVPPSPNANPPVPDSERMKWFQNIKAGQPFDLGRTSLDYSLQLSIGIDRFREANLAPNN